VSQGTPRQGALPEPYLLFLALAGAGVATLPLAQPARLAVLFVAMAALAVGYGSGRVVELRLSAGAVWRGALLGLVISLPVLAFLPGQLRQFNERLYGTTDVVMIFYQACLVAAPLEEFFFRGIVAQGRGPSASVGLYASMGLIYFAPHAPFLAVVTVTLAMALLGLVYTHIQESHGLAAATACHLVAAFVLQVWPSLLGSLRLILG
jgi:membrane protease YdiL (CAAX protease family)